eukprot:c2410_g1_i1.p1 GENE.c2410_g1_i1~~c2410_g1_i1.p1  ORF type:complete len:324 (-),score=39.92 c2410_g1_i1:2-973(-)
MHLFAPSSCACSLRLLPHSAVYAAALSLTPPRPLRAVPQRAMCGLIHDHGHDPKATPGHFLKNKFIRTGYSVSKSHWAALSTLYRFDNETVNVYTVAVFGIAPLAALLWSTLARWPSDLALPPHVSPAVVGCGIALALLNCVFTMAYHVFCSYPRFYHAWSAVDLFGIAIALLSYALGLIGAGIHYPFFPVGMAPAMQAAWLTAFGLPFGACIAAYRMWIKRESPVWLLVINVAVGLFVTLPLFMAHRGGESARAVITVVLLLGGLTLYIGKVPERIEGLRFAGIDLVGNSHQIWHCAYNIAFYLFFVDMIHTQPALAQRPGY